MIPTIGRTVIFVPDRVPVALEAMLPATIVRVHDDRTVNLQVFQDGPQPHLLWERSVLFSEQPVPRSWHWPVKILPA